MRAGAKDVEFHPVPPRTEEVGDDFPPKRDEFYPLAVLVGDLTGVFQGVAEEVGVNLREKPHVNSQAKFFVRHAPQAVVYLDACLFKAFAVALKLGLDNLFGKAAGPFAQDKAALLEMFPAQEAFQKKAHRLVVFFYLLIVIKELLVEKL